jgi:hypothetical protein
MTERKEEMYKNYQGKVGKLNAQLFGVNISEVFLI